MRSMIYLAGVSLSRDPVPLPSYKVLFHLHVPHYISTLLSRLCLSTPLRFLYLAWSFLSILLPPTTRPSNTHPPHPHLNSHPNYLTLHTTQYYPTTLSRLPTTHSPTLSSLPLRANSTHTLPSPSYLTPSNSNFYVIE